MDERVRQLILAKLRETQQIFLAESQDVSEEQARWKPAPECWSILECAEHVAVAEQGMLYLLTKRTTPRLGAPRGAGREQDFLARGTDRTKKFKAPERAAPSGRFATLVEALSAFEANRSRTIAYIEGCQADLRADELFHPLVGPVTAQECLALLTIHPARHALQVRELRQHPQFPK